jgi:hypothetical protein
MAKDRHSTSWEGILDFFMSPAVVLSVLLALLGAYLWPEHREEALIAFLWIPIVFTCSVMHSLFHARRSSH